jgi:hypothetical protein
MKTKSEVLSGYRFESGNGVRHPKLGDGLVICGWNRRGLDDAYMVQFDSGITEIVQTKDLESLPSKAEYRKSNRQLSMEAGQRHAQATKQERKIKEAKRRAKLKANQGKTRIV